MPLEGLSMQKNDKTGWIYFIIVLLGLTLLIRLIDEAQLINHFPFGFTNDISAYLGQLHFTKVCGFHNWCPYWYNGFTHLLINQPGWYLFAYPLYLLLGSVTAVTYASMVLLYALGFVAIWILGHHLQLDKIKRVAFYLLFFANAGIIGNTLRNSRQHAMLTLVLFVFLFTLMWYYKDRHIRWPFFLTSIVYSFMIVTHYQETILACLLFVSLFIYKKGLKERMAVVMAGVLSVILSLWWVKGFLSGIGYSLLLTLNEGIRIFEWSREIILTNTLTFLIPAVFVGLWWYAKMHDKENRELLFFLPICILAILYFFRITIFIPVVKNISQDPYLSLFLFFIFVILFTYEKKIMSQLLMGKIVKSGLVAITIASVLVSMFYTPFFEKAHSLDEEIISLFPSVDRRMLFISPLKSKDGLVSYTKPLYSYGSIYHEIFTSAGWSPPLVSSEYFERIEKLEKIFVVDDPTDCEDLKQELLFFNTTDIITTLDACDKLEACGLEKRASTENACLYVVS